MTRRRRYAGSRRSTRERLGWATIQAPLASVEPMRPSAGDTGDLGLGIRLGQVSRMTA
jgi:hypothetical protein